jgi:hypothetical protein
VGGGSRVGGRVLRVCSGRPTGAGNHVTVGKFLGWPDNIWVEFVLIPVTYWCFEVNDCVAVSVGVLFLKRLRASINVLFRFQKTRRWEESSGVWGGSGVGCPGGAGRPWESGSTGASGSTGDTLVLQVGVWGWSLYKNSAKLQYIYTLRKICAYNYVFMHILTRISSLLFVIEIFWAPRQKLQQQYSSLQQALFGATLFLFRAKRFSFFFSG